MHKYWGKKPFNLISAFIKRNTQPGEIVLDPFCGSGVTAIEAIKNNRKGITVDINPIAIQLTKVSLTPVPKNDVVSEFKKMEQKLRDKIYSMYESKCPICGRTITTTHTIWNEETPTEVWYKCSCKKGKLIKPAGDQDYKDAFEPNLSPDPYPDNDMIQNSRINIQEGQKVSDLFTPRALVGLSYIRTYIDSIENPAVKDIMEIVLTGTLSQASKLVFVIRNRKGKDGEKKGAEVGSWVAGYWVPEEHFEINVWNCFDNRFSRVLKGISEINSLFTKPPILLDKYEPDATYNGIIELCSATSLDIPDDYVDYVFTDPPHVNRVLYMEMSLMWNTWLRANNLEWDKEVVISEARTRGKNSQNYNELIDLAIKEIGRVLKENRTFSIAFNSLDDLEWKALFDVCTKNGFELNDIRPLEYSATSVMQDNRKNGLQTDFVLSFTNQKKPLQSIPINNNQASIKDEIYRSIGSNRVRTYEVINDVMIASLKQGSFTPPGTIIDLLHNLDDLHYEDYLWSRQSS